MEAIGPRSTICPGRVCCRSSCKVRMVAGCFGRDTLCGIVFEHGIDEFKSSWFQSRDKLARGFTTPFRERRLEVGERSDAWPGGFIRGAEQPGSWSTWSSILRWNDQRRASSWKQTYLKILKISSISESPGKSGFRVHISAKMAPTDHISTPVEYCRPPRRISGARYHSVTT